MVLILIIIGLIFLSVFGPKFLSPKRVKIFRIILVVALVLTLIGWIFVSFYSLIYDGNPQPLISSAIVVVCGIAYLLIQKPKLGTTIVVGLLTLPVFPALMFLPKIFKALGTFKEVSSAPLIYVFAIILAVCVIGFLIGIVMCTISAIKLVGKNKEKVQDFLEKTFRITTSVSAIFLLIFLLCTILKIPKLGVSYTSILFFSGDFAISAYIIPYSLLILMWSLVGLFISRKEEKLVPIEQQTILSNRIGLSIISFVISIFSLLPAVVLLQMSFVGELTGKTLINMVQTMSNAPTSLIIISKMFILCTLMSVLVVLLSGVSTVIAGKLQYENAKKLLNVTFITAILFSAITLIFSIVKFDFIYTKASITEMLSAIEMVWLFTPPLIIILVLGVLGYLLIRNSKKVSVAELNAIKAQKREINKENAQKTMENVNKDVETGISNIKKGVEVSTDITKQYTKQYLPIVKQFLLKIKNILFNPKTTWLNIEEENTPHIKILTSYVLPLAVIVAVFAFIGWGFIGYEISAFGQTIPFHSASYGFKMAIALFILMIGGIYLSALAINLLSVNFGARKDFDKVFSLVAYSYTPVLLGGMFHIVPNLSWLWWLISLYSFYLFYTGTKPMLQTPEEKNTSYLVVSILCLVVICFVLEQILEVVFKVNAFGNIAL